MAHRRTTYIGAVPEASAEIPVIQINLGGGVNSVNGQTGDVVLTAEDVGAFPADGAISFTFAQETPADVWTIAHNLGRFPSVTTVDAVGREIVGAVDYVSENELTITFSAPVSGSAYLN